MNMQYFFVKHATTNYGPINFPLIVVTGEDIKQAVEREGKIRGCIICHDWQAEPIDREECAKLLYDIPIHHLASRIYDRYLDRVANR